MGTWVGVLVESGNRADFWELARKHRVEPPGQPVVAPWVLLDGAADFDAAPKLAETLARELNVRTVGIVIQTASDVHEQHVFKGDRCIRRLCYSRDEGGWLTVEGTAQEWEASYFFDDTGSTAEDSASWPDLLSDEISGEDIARYERAKAQRDASSVMDLLGPSSMFPMLRVCTFLGIDGHKPHGKWAQPTFWERLTGRR